MGLLTDVHGRGVIASRPAAGHAGRFYYSTDTSTNYRDNGSSWDAQSTGGTSDLDAIITASSGQDIADALAGAAAPDAGNVFATMADVGGGGAAGPVLLGTYVATAQATLDCITRNASGQSGALIQSDHKIYEAIIFGLLPATNNVALGVQVSTNGGVSFDSTAGHYHSRNFTMGGGSGMDTEATTSFGISFSGANITNDAAHGGVRGTVRYFTAATGSAYPAMSGHTVWWDGAQNSAALPNCSYLTAGAAVDALRFLFSSGNITSGAVVWVGL